MIDKITKLLEDLEDLVDSLVSVVMGLGLITLVITFSIFLWKLIMAI